LRGAGVDAALTETLKSSPVAAQRVLIRALAFRDARTATPVLVKIASASDATVRRESLAAIGKLGDENACQPLIRQLDQSPPGERDWYEGALGDICRRDPAAVPAVAAALPQAAPSSQIVLLGVLGAAGGSPACTAVRGQLKSNQPEVRLAAVRVLAEWPDAEPLEDLATVAETTNDATVRAVAVRGLNRLAPQAPGRARRAAEALVRALSGATDPADQKSFLAALVAIPSVASLKAAQAQLKNSALAAEAAAGLVNIAEIIYPWHQPEVKAALAELKSANPPADLNQRAEALSAKLDQPANLALGGLATSPDGLEKDGEAGGDQAAIDGNPKTYWDEADNQKLYRLRVQLRERSTVGFLRLTGFQQHNYAPKDFEVLCDDKVVTTVRGAIYQNNVLSVEFPAVSSEVVELKITGYHGQSPAIRELEIYEKPLPK
jgi:HEAT repeat protein